MEQGTRNKEQGTRNKEHYEEFDFPDNLNDQIDWLKNNGFNKIRRTSYEKFWTYLSVRKE